LLLNDFGIEPLPAVETYCGYDSEEAQERAASPEKFIISDIVSMVTHAPWKVFPA
jgi:hypothetical protein